MPIEEVVPGGSLRQIRCYKSITTLVNFNTKNSNATANFLQIVSFVPSVPVKRY